jgi:hypothetical protein
MTGAVVVGGKKQVPHQAFARFGMTSLLRRFGMTEATEPVRNDKRLRTDTFGTLGQPGAAVPYIPFPVRREKIGDDIGSFGGAWVLRPAKNAGLRMTSLVEEESVGSWHAAVFLEPL